MQEQRMNALYESYYHDSNGEYTDIHSCIGNCFSRNVFFVLRNKLKKENCMMENNLYKSFLEELSFYLRIDEKENIIGIGMTDLNFWKKLVSNFNSFEFRGEGGEKKAIEQIEKLLDLGFCIIVNTRAKNLKFHSNYHLDIDPKYLDSRNVNFLILHYDKENFYYVYTFTLYNKIYYLPCKENNSIGVAPKSDFFKAFRDRVNLYTITENFKELENSNINVCNSINLSIQNYFSEETAILIGRKCLELILKKLRGDGLLLKIVSSAEFDDDTLPFSYESLNITIKWLCNRRKQYKFLFERFELHELPIIKNIIIKIESSISYWEAFSNLVKYIFFKKEDFMDARGIKYIENILSSEDDFFSYLNEHKQYILELICIH